MRAVTLTINGCMYVCICALNRKYIRLKCRSVPLLLDISDMVFICETLEYIRFESLRDEYTGSTKFPI